MSAEVLMFSGGCQQSNKIEIKGCAISLYGVIEAKLQRGAIRNEQCRIDPRFWPFSISLTYKK